MSDRVVSLTTSPHTGTDGSPVTGYLRTDHDQDFYTETTTGRLQWTIPEAVTGGGIREIKAIGYQTDAGRMVLPPGSSELVWEKAGQLVTEPLALVPMSLPSLGRPLAQGRQFVLNGQPWRWAMMTGFCDYLRFLTDPGGLDTVLREAQALGSTGRRVLLQMHFITHFYPRDYPTFYDQLPAFVAKQNAFGQIPELVIYADEQIIDSGRSHFDRVCAAVKDLPCVVELANEFSKNGVDPYSFPRFVDGLTFSRGSDTSEAPIVQPPGNYATFRERRDLWKCIGRGYKADEACWDFGFDVPFVYNEPIGAAETEQPGRRSANPALFAALAAQYRAVGAFSTFHSEAGLLSVPLGPVQRQCATAFFQALT